MQSAADTSVEESASTTLVIPASTDPKVQESATIAVSLLRQVDVLTIDSNDMYDLANGMLADIHARGKLLEAARLSITTPITAGLNAVRNMFRQPEENIELAKDTLKRKMVTFQTKVADERRKAQEEAAAEHRRQLAEAAIALAAAEKGLVEGKVTGQEYVAAEVKMAEAEVSTPHVPATEGPRGGGHAIGEKWSAEVVDLPKFLRYLADELERGDKRFDATITLKVGQLNTFAKATKGTSPLPGVKFISEKTISAR